jgi:flavodoxin
MATEKAKHQQSEHQDLWDLIENMRINKKYLADLTGMNAYTFKMKLKGIYPTYKFTETEIKMIRDSLCELGDKLKGHCSKKK